MAEDPADKIAEGKLDLVPMIDCIMLLLLFFILTTKFVAEEKAIASLLPTDKGQAPSPATAPVDPPKTINICIYPEGMVKGLSKPSEYQKKYDDLKKIVGEVLPTALLRMGGDEPRLIDGNSFSRKGHAGLKSNMDMVHAYIANALTQRENASVLAHPGDPRHQRRAALVADQMDQAIAELDGHQGVVGDIFQDDLRRVGCGGCLCCGSGARGTLAQGRPQPRGERRAGQEDGLRHRRDHPDRTQDHRDRQPGSRLRQLPADLPGQIAHVGDAGDDHGGGDRQ